MASPDGTITLSSMLGFALTLLLPLAVGALSVRLAFRVSRNHELFGGAWAILIGGLPTPFAAWAFMHGVVSYLEASAPPPHQLSGGGDGPAMFAIMAFLLAICLYALLVGIASATIAFKRWRRHQAIIWSDEMLAED